MSKEGGFKMLKNEKGYTLLFSIVAIVIITVLGLSLYTMSANGTQKNEKRDEIIQAESLATKGLDYLVAKINKEIELALEKTDQEYKDYNAQNINPTEQFKFAEKFDQRFQQILKTYECPQNFSASNDSNINNMSKYGYCVMLKYNGTNLNLQPTQFTLNMPEQWYTVNETDDGVKKVIAFKSIGSAASDSTKKTLYARKIVGIELSGTGQPSEGGSQDTNNGGGLVITDEEVRLNFAISTFEGVPVDDTIYNRYYTVGKLSSNANYTAQNTDKENGIYKSVLSGVDNHLPKENGSVYLHGGVDVIGKMFVQNNLYVADRGMPRYSSYVFSSLPRFINYFKVVNGKEVEQELGSDGAFNLNNTKASIIYLGKGNGNFVGKNTIYQSKLENYSSSKHSSYLINPSSSQITITNLYTDPTKKIVSLSNGVGPANLTNLGVEVKKDSTVTSNNPLASMINIEEKGAIIKGIVGSTVTSGCSGTSSTAVYKMYCANDVTLSGKNLILTKRTAPSGQTPYVDIKDKQGVGYIKGDLTLKGTSTVKGTFYIDGNLIIEGATISAEAVFYVRGTVSVESTSIKSLETNGKKGTLIVFANKNIGLQAISSNSKTPSNMKAFFLSNYDIAITGSTSHVLINGGLSARSIELTAMRGPDSSTWKASCKGKPDYDIDNCQNIGDLYESWKKTTSGSKFESQMRSRLTVAYNPEILDTYKDYAVEELKYSVAPIAEKDRTLK